MTLFDLAAKISLDSSDYEKGLNEAEGKTQSFGSKLGSALGTVGSVAAGALTAATGAVTAFAGSAVQTGQEFDVAVSQIAATLGKSVDEVGDLRAKAEEMGAATNFSASQAAEGLNILAMSGFDAAQSMEMIEDVLHLAAAGSMNMASAAGYISGAMKGFNDETKNSVYYADLMAKGATLANTSVSQLGEAMASGASGAAAYGQSAESMTVALLRLAEQGEVGSAAGTALAAAMKDLYTPSDQAASALAELGVAAYENGKALDFNDIVNNLSNALSGLSEEEANNYKQTIFGIQGMRAFTQMTVTSTEKQEEWADALANSAGEASKQYDTMTDNLQGDMDILSSAMDGLKIAVSDQLTPTLREFTQFASDSIGQVTAAFKEGGIEGAMDALGPVLSEGIAMITEKLPEFIEAGMGLLSALGQGIMDNLPQLLDAATQIVISMAEFIIQALPEIVEAGLQLIITLAEGIAEALPELIPTIVDVVLKIVEVLTDPDNIGTLIDAALAIILALADGLIQALPQLLEKAPEIIMNLVEAFLESIPKILEAGVELIGALIEGILSVDFGELAEGVKQKLSEAWEKAKEAWAKVGEWASERWEDIKGAFATAGEWFGNKFEEAKQAAQKAWEKIGDWFGERKEDVQNAWQSIDGWMGDKFGASWEAVKNAFKPFVDYFKMLWENVKEIFSVVKDVLSGDFEGAWEGIKSIWDRVVDFFKGIWDGIKNAFSNVGQWFKNVFDDAVKGIKQIFNDLVKGAVNWGRDLVDNFIGGIKNMWNNFTGTLSDMAGAVASFLGFSEPEKGPLSNFHTFAPDMMNLFIKGIKDNEGRLQSAVADAFDFQPIISDGYGTGGGGWNGNMSITINTQPGQNAEEIANYVERKIINEFTRRKMVSA